MAGNLNNPDRSKTIRPLPVNLAMEYFELFGLPVSLKTDPALLSKRYFELQKKYHPDFYTQAGEDEQADALERSSLANKALKVLQSETETIKYVLQQKHLITVEEKYPLPPAFLSEVMELNENLSEHSSMAITNFENAIYGEIKDIIYKYDDNTITTEELLKLKEYYYKKKYLHRILERMDG